MILMLISALIALGLAHLFELSWSEAPQQLHKLQAMRFIWLTVGASVVFSQLSAGLLMALAGLPVCLAHLRLVERQQGDEPIAVADVVRLLLESAREKFRSLMDHMQKGPR